MTAIILFLAWVVWGLWELTKTIHRITKTQRETAELMIRLVEEVHRLESDFYDDDPDPDDGESIPEEPTSTVVELRRKAA